MTEDPLRCEFGHPQSPEGELRCRLCSREFPRLKAANGKPSSPVLCVAEGCPSPPFIKRQWAPGPGGEPVHESQPQQHVEGPDGPYHFGCWFRYIRRARGLVA